MDTQKIIDFFKNQNILSQLYREQKKVRNLEKNRAEKLRQRIKKNIPQEKWKKD